MISRVNMTERAAELLSVLCQRHGSLLFHQSGGCCDGSAPLCFTQQEFRVGDHDILLGEIGGCPFYISEFLYGYWQNCVLTIDALPGRGSGFSLESAEGMRFVTLSRLLSEEELAAVSSQESRPPP
ncbi:DUF779 domain-containing protein [Aquitalea palustris]|uniref:DUF779 domain-containing protein n=1 Tax=Aquitalea palustris TaxID=2480983 RepID=A0A454JDN9_9NEIS|nr:DUF779 domain-containing protein [Aquitalea palustris]RMC91750.1 DUF779 domain-containing protein [Aquitalea palustris]